ncbi:MAG: LysR family transcriptional regulator, partial [Methylococcales bacterium]|nr:LysR family transcriptional regulator [Methylococcales bacterium]
MKRRSIPLQTLHAFEATARHLSFTKAANELNLSQSAVSQQIQTLEYAVGVKLFVRMTRKIMLTKKGELFSREVRKSLELLDNAQDNLFPPQDGKQLS